MSKRRVSLLLLSAVLLTQWLSSGQCHACRHAEHGHAPHLHLAWLPFFRLACPDEGCCPHDGADDDDEEDGSPGQEPVPHRHPTGIPHDGGVVFLPTALCHGWLVSRAFTSPDPVAAHTQVMTTSQDVLNHFRPHGGAQCPPPLRDAPDCPTYLRTLALRI
jgi:hypothetical protein